MPSAPAHRPAKSKTPEVKEYRKRIIAEYQQVTTDDIHQQDDDDDDNNARRVTFTTKKCTIRVFAHNERPCSIRNKRSELMWIKMSDGSFRRVRFAPREPDFKKNAAGQYVRVEPKHIAMRVSKMNVKTIIKYTEDVHANPVNHVEQPMSPVSPQADQGPGPRPPPHLKPMSSVEVMSSTTNTSAATAAVCQETFPEFPMVFQWRGPDCEPGGEIAIDAEFVESVKPIKSTTKSIVKTVKLVKPVKVEHPTMPLPVSLKAPFDMPPRCPDMTITTTQLFDHEALDALIALGPSVPGGIGTECKLRALKSNMNKNVDYGCQTITFAHKNGKDKKLVAQLGYGRLYGQDSSLESFKKSVRATLCAKYYHDLDFENCHPVILVQLAYKTLGEDLPHLFNYLKNREEILKRIMDKANITRNDAKQTMITMLYGGYPKFDVTELHDIYHETSGFTSRLIASGFFVEAWNATKADDTVSNKVGSFLSFILQSIENDLLLAFKSKLEARGWSSDVLVYDGLMVRRRADATITPELLGNLEIELFESTGYEMTITEKAMEPLDLTTFCQNPEVIAKDEFNSRAPIFNKKNTLEFIKEVCDLVPDVVIATDTTRVKFFSAIWNTTTNATRAEIRDLMIQQLERVAEEGKGGVHDTIDDIIAHHIQPRTTFGTLVYMVKNANKAGAYAKIYKKHNKHTADRLKLVDNHTELTPFQTTEYSERHVKPFAETLLTSDIVLKSHLKTGKTTQTLAAIKANKWIRILVMSPRKTYSNFVLGDWAAQGVPFECYLNIDGTLADVPRLICQIESLHRIESDSMGFKPYDLVVMDESETILKQLDSETTHGRNMTKNSKAFEKIVRTAGRVIYADAFITMRSLKNCELLRNPAKTQYIINNFCPFTRKAKELYSIVTRDDREVEVPATADFCKHISSDLAYGKRVCVVFTSRTKGQGFIDHFVKDVLKDHEWRFYNSMNNKDIGDLRNVEKAWAPLKLVAMTSTITIGVNYNINSRDSPKYDPALDHLKFDRVYLYACAATSLPRDIAQALMRCREIRSEQLIFTIDTSVFNFPVSGEDAIRAELRETEEANRLEHPEHRWVSMPEWAIANHVYNAQEEADKTYNYRDTLYAYLDKSGARTVQVFSG